MPVGVTMEDMICSSPTTEAWFDILKWLPTRSVLELRLVCREWHGLIMTDCFIQSHVIHANLKRSPRIKFICDPRFGYYLDLEECIGQKGLLPYLNLVCSQPCHGLNVGSCVFWDFLCNPTTGYLKYITFDDNDGSFFAGHMGLGYDTEIDQHVMVHITYKERNLETRYYELQCKMKYVDAYDEWDTIDPPSRPVAGIPPTFVNGKIYWMVDPDLGPVSAGCEIVAFDVNKQEFEVLQGPPCTHGSGHMTILELQGALCISYTDQSRNTVDLWIMEDDGIWLMEYHIVLDKLEEYAAPLAVDPTDGRILMNTGWSLGYYDPRTAAFETIYTKTFWT
jgi:F-box interacting protein